MTEPPLDNTHECPGCKQPGIKRNRLACAKCWFRLPLVIRWRLRSTHGVDIAGHRVAVRHAINWYVENRHLVKQADDLEPPEEK